jgi:hypothetical protein
MDKQPQSRAPLIIAIVLLILPLLYVGSYLAMVTPSRNVVDHSPQGPLIILQDYRYADEWCHLYFWPLEQIDRKLRAGAWNRFSSLYGEAIVV